MILQAEFKQHSGFIEDFFLTFVLKSPFLYFILPFHDDYQCWKNIHTKFELLLYIICKCWVRAMVFNATVNNISVISL